MGPGGEFPPRPFFGTAEKSERYFREIITAVISKQFEPLDAHLITQMTGVGSHNTIADYLEALDGFYLLRSINQPKTLGAVLPAFKKRKKIYFRVTKDSMA